MAKTQICLFTERVHLQPCSGATSDHSASGAPLLNSRFVRKTFKLRVETCKNDRIGNKQKPPLGSTSLSLDSHPNVNARRSGTPTTRRTTESQQNQELPQNPTTLGAGRATLEDLTGMKTSVGGQKEIALPVDCDDVNGLTKQVGRWGQPLGLQIAF
jgi:hypothetical protein